jgi:PhzF family phenazine biosynthesis protein
VRAFVVDAFTSAAFAGNPAGVVLLDEAADASWMQALAAELKHSETAFVRPRDDGTYDLRWFTPAAEVDLCGHATLATAHVLHASGAPGPYVFDTRSGLLTATVHGASIELDFPATPVHPSGEPDGLADALGTRPVGTYSNGTDALVEVADAGTVAALTPDIRALAAVECRGVVVTAAASPGADHDFVSRFFAPRVGVDEDPVTGSAHCALAPFWADRLGRTRMVGEQLSPRGGRVGVEVRGERVLLSGSAVTVLAGDLLG